jgi:hypothetical protein
VPRSRIEILSSELRSIESTRVRVDELFARRELRVDDVDRIYEGLFMRAINSLETFFENQFYDHVLRPPRGRSPRIEPVAKFRTRKGLEEVVLAGGDFAKWLPTRELMMRSSIFLKDGGPFSKWDDGEKSKLAQWTRIRNAIAHPSAHASKEFRTRVIAGLPLRPTQKTPARYLRSEAQAGQTRFEFAMRDMRAIALTVT